MKSTKSNMKYVCKSDAQTIARIEKRFARMKKMLAKLQNNQADKD